MGRFRTERRTPLGADPLERTIVHAGSLQEGRVRRHDAKAAFLVKCDSETTTPYDQSIGVVNIVVGFAPLRPAEFVVLQIQQLAGQTAA